MADSIAATVGRIKRDPAGVLDRARINALCEELGHDWRERELDPATTLALFLQQVLHGNCPCSEVRHLPAGAAEGRSFTGSAYCDARKRLPLSVYQAVLTDVIDAALPATRRDEHLWLGLHRVFLIDGSTFSMPDTPELREAFGMPSGQARGCGFPVAHLLVLFSAGTGLLLDAWAGPLRTGDVAQVPEAAAHLLPGDVLLGDDSFSSYVHLALLSRDKLHGLFPAHHKRIVSFRPRRRHCPEGKKAVAGMPRSRWVKYLGKDDQLVEYFKPKQGPRWMSKAEYDALPDSIIVRELRRHVRGPAGNPVTLTMVTTLTDPGLYPAGDLVALRLRRWDVETNIRHLKTTMGMDVLRCKTEAGVRKELAMFCIAHNLVRVVMLEAAERQQVPVARVSFADALKWMRHARPGAAMPDLVVNPHRPGRAEPRCKKRRAKQFDLMNKPRDVLRQRLKKQRKNA
jgi:Transposase DDE domain